MIFAIIVWGCSKKENTRLSNTNLSSTKADALTSFFAKKYDEPSLVLHERAVNSDSVVIPVGVQTGLPRIRMDNAGPIFELIVAREMDGCCYDYHYMFSVNPQYERLEDLHLSSILNGRSLTQYSIWRIDANSKVVEDVASEGVWYVPSSPSPN